MGKKTFADLLVQLTIDKAKKEGKHPMEIIDKLKVLIAEKRRMEQLRILQGVSKIFYNN